MGCGCGKRAKKILDVADRKNVRLPAKARRFLERKAQTAKPVPKRGTV